MNEYGLSVFTICIISALTGLFGYGLSGAEKNAVGIITACLVLLPPIAAVGKIDLAGLTDGTPPAYIMPDTDYGDLLEEYFCDGISEAICKRFDIDSSSVTVRAVDFSVEEMKAGEIWITLSGAGALSDYRAVESYVDGLDVGVCRLEIQFG